MKSTIALNYPLSIRKKYLEFLLAFVNDNKRSLFEKYILNRTRYITVVLEDIYQPQNASAVLRTCDCLGIQDIHIIENYNKYQVNPDVVKGSDKWLTLKKYSQEGDNTMACLKSLKQQGYRIVVTSPHKNEVMLEDLSMEQGKFALVFGNELAGISVSAAAEADEYVKIPMYGFTESYNISVSAAILLYHLTGKMRQSTVNWQLKENEKVDVLLDWCFGVLNNPDLLEKEFFNKRIK